MTVWCCCGVVSYQQFAVLRTFYDTCVFTMANYQENWTYGRFESLVNGPNATLLDLPISSNLGIGDIFTIIEVDNSSIPTGRQAKGTVKLLSSGEFFNQSKTKNIYYFSPMQRMPWIDISGSSTIIGWSSFTTKIIQYQVFGDSVLVQWELRGTSNSTSSSFTVPIPKLAGTNQSNGFAQSTNNGVQEQFAGRANIAAGASIVNLIRNWQGNTWANSGTKISVGEIIYRWR